MIVDTKESRLEILGTVLKYFTSNASAILTLLVSGLEPRAEGSSNTIWRNVLYLTEFQEGVGDSGDKFTISCSNSVESADRLGSP